MINTIKRILDELKVIRRVVLFWCLGLTTYAYMYIFEFLQHCEKLDVNTATVIAAILTPISALQGFVVKFYHSGRSQEEIRNGDL